MTDWMHLYGHWAGETHLDSPPPEPPREEMRPQDWTKLRLRRLRRAAKWGSRS